jgi:hypothetical protein
MAQPFREGRRAKVIYSDIPLAFLYSVIELLNGVVSQFQGDLEEI